MLVPLSLKAVGKIIGKEKMEQNYHIEEITPEYKAYFERDLEITEHLIKEFYLHYTPKLTIASSTLNEFKLDYGSHNFSKNFNGTIYNYITKQ
ncbi:MAG: hypothetical protein ACRCXT_03480 [Paraclostridium sp.]